MLGILSSSDKACCALVDCCCDAKSVNYKPQLWRTRLKLRKAIAMLVLPQIAKWPPATQPPPLRQPQHPTPETTPAAPGRHLSPHSYCFGFAGSYSPDQSQSSSQCSRLNNMQAWSCTCTHDICQHTAAGSVMGVAIRGT